MSYPSLVRTLDALRREAPLSFRTYHPDPDDIERLNQARAIAFIHLFIKVRFGVADFDQRHELILDGSQDGGVDAFYIDQDARTVTLLQAKFRTSERNFEGKSIEISELLRMEVGRISRGESNDSNGVPFSSRVRAFQRRVNDIRDIALYSWRVVILANLARINDEQMRRLLDNMEYEVFDFPRTYRELVFPLATGTSFVPGTIVIKLNMGRKSLPQLHQDIDTGIGKCEVRMLFVPTLEVARVMAKYRNALLRFNPRNFLSLSGNEVNQSIKNTMRNTTRNEFSLRNNGITIVAEYSSLTDRTGASGEGQLIISDPQIINGGQTAATLAMMLEEDAGDAAFESKEVLIKIISRPEGKSESELAEFISSISDATNKQSRIVEADRRANDARLVDLQAYFYESFGLYLERKRGEFLYGLKDKIIQRAEVVSRVTLLRAMTAFGGNAARARSSQDRVFEEEGYNRLMNSFDNVRIAVAYFCIRLIETSEGLAGGRRVPAHALRYGKFAMVAAMGHAWNDSGGKPADQAKHLVGSIADRWLEFETLIVRKSLNAKYLVDGEFNFDGYYKGSTVDADIADVQW